MIDQIGTEGLEKRSISKRKLSKMIGLGIVAAMVTVIMALWGAFLVWAAVKFVLWTASLFSL